MKRTLSVLLLGGVLAAAAVPAVAGPHRGGHARGPEARIERLDEMVGLTDDQKSEMRAIAEAHREASRALRMERREAMQALDAAITSGADNDTIAELAIAAHGIAGELRAVRKDIRQEVKGVLTEEQVATLKAMRAERREAREAAGFEGRRGHRGQGRRGQGGFDL